MESVPKPIALVDTLVLTLIDKRQIMIRLVFILLILYVDFNSNHKLTCIYRIDKMKTNVVSILFYDENIIDNK